MRVTPRRRRARAAGSLVVALAAFLGAAGTPHAAADEVTGDWTGAVSLRGHYYWEQSTRVVAPSLAIALDSPKGLHITGEYLVDAITSASIAAGTLVDRRFTEIRHDISVGVSGELARDRPVELSASARVSREPDYTSLSGSAGVAVSLNDRATTLRLGLGYLHDEVRQRFQLGSGARPTAGGGTTAGGFSEDFDALSLSVSWDQVVSPTVTTQLTYELSYLDGFLANAYRSVLIGGASTPETHPGTRSATR